MLYKTKKILPLFFVIGILFVTTACGGATERQMYDDAIEQIMDAIGAENPLASPACWG